MTRSPTESTVRADRLVTMKDHRTAFSQRRAVIVRGRNRWLAVVILVSMLAFGCGGYSGASPRTYAYANALYTICNRRHTAKLDEVAVTIADDAARGELPAGEARWLEAIVEDARRGEWTRGMKTAREIIRQQASR